VVIVGALSALLIAGVLAGLCFMWLLAGRPPRRARLRSRRRGRADEALRRHPAGRGRLAAPEGTADWAAEPAAAGGPAGPDDDPDFIRSLERRIRGEDDDPG
jgi:hypothetical protein